MYVPGIHPVNIALTPRHNRVTPSLMTISRAIVNDDLVLDVEHFSHWIFVFKVSIGKMLICSARPAMDPAIIWSTNDNRVRSHSCQSGISSISIIGKCYEADNCCGSGPNQSCVSNQEKNSAGRGNIERWFLLFTTTMWQKWFTVSIAIHHPLKCWNMYHRYI